MVVTIKLQGVEPVSFRNEQMRHLNRNPVGNLRDVNPAKIVSRVTAWFLSQPDEVKDQIVGDLFAHDKEESAA